MGLELVDLRLGVPCAGVRLAECIVGVSCSSEPARLPRLLPPLPFSLWPIGCALSSIIREASAEGICVVSLGMLDFGSFNRNAGVAGITDVNEGGPIGSLDFSCCCPPEDVLPGPGGGGGGGISDSGMGSGEIDSDELPLSEPSMLMSFISKSFKICCLDEVAAACCWARL